MKTHARVVVIGEAAWSGAGTLYHLAKKGWSDVVLIERKELTSGSTWHGGRGLLAAGFNMGAYSFVVSTSTRVPSLTGQGSDGGTGQAVRASGRGVEQSVRSAPR